MLSIQKSDARLSGGVRALSDVSLEIPAGMFGLLGPNGAGKSTLMRCIATLQAPTDGAIRVQRDRCHQRAGKVAPILGYLSQDFGVYPRGSAYDMLDHMAVLKGVTGVGERRETVEALLQQVNLLGVRKKAIAGFSGGMRQRFGIAPIAPGYRISEVVKDGRRTVRFKSETPILYFSSMQSATYAVKHNK